MTIDKLYELRDNGSFDGRYCQKVDLLLQAVTDWPKPVDTVESFLADVRKFLNCDKLSSENIYSGMKKLNPADFSWELEALSSLLELVGMEDNTNLDSFLRDNPLLAQ